MRQRRVLLLISMIVLGHNVFYASEDYAIQYVDDSLAHSHCLDEYNLERLSQLLQALSSATDISNSRADDERAATGESHYSRQRVSLLLLLQKLLYHLQNEDMVRSFGSIKQLYAISAELASVGLGPNFAITSTPQTIKVAPQFSRTAGGIQELLIGVAEPDSTQPSIIKIGNNLIGTLGATTIDIGTGPQPTAITLGNANPASTLTFPGNVVVTGSINVPVFPPFTNLALAGDFTVGGNETVVGTLTAMSLTVLTPPIVFTNLHLTGDLTVGGVSTFNGPLAGHSGAMVTGGAFSALVGDNQISLTSTQAVNDAILLTAMSTATRGLTATVGATNGFTITGGPFIPQATFAITNGDLMQMGGAVALDAGAGTIDFTSTLVSPSAIQLAGNLQVTGNFNPLLTLTAESGIEVTGGSLTVAGGITINGDFMQSGGTLSLTSTGAATIDSTGSITIGGTNATGISIGDATLSTTITGGLTQLGGPLSLTSTGAAVIDVIGAPGTLIIGASAMDITLGNRTAAGNDLIIEGGDTAPGGIYIATANVAHQIDIGTGTPALGVESVDIGIHDTPSNMISIGGNASTTTVKGDLTQTAGLFTLNGVGTSSINSATGTLTFGGTSGTVNIGNTNDGTIVTLESGPTGALDFGNSANLHTINIGTGAAVNTVNIGTGTAANTISIGGSPTSVTTFHGNLTQSGGNLLLTSIGTGIVDATTTLMLGASTATAVSIGNNAAAANAILIEGGSMAPGGIFVGTSDASHLINIGTGSPGAGGQSIMIGNGATPTNTIIFGGGANSTTTIMGALTKTAGSPFTLTSIGTATIDSAATLNIGMSTAMATNIGSPTTTTAISIEGATIDIGNANIDHMFFIADGIGAQTITIGSTNDGSRVTLQGGIAAGVNNGVRYQVGAAGLPSAPIGYSLPIASTPASVRISSGLLTNTTTITAAGTNDWTHSSGTITFTNAFTSSSTAYVTVLDYGATSPIGNAVTPVFAPATMAADGTTLTIGGYNTANFYAFLVMGR